MNKCEYCRYDTKGETSITMFENPKTFENIAIQFPNELLEVIFNGNIIGQLEIEFCPMCGRKFESEETKNG